MTRDEAEHIIILINSKGFDYVFQHYSDFKDIKDKDFHKLRRAYLRAMDKLARYIEKELESDNS